MSDLKQLKKLAKRKTKYTGSEWKEQDLLDSWDIISGYARDKYKLTFHEPQFEIVNEEMMIDALCYHALPSLYSHWSFGKEFIESYKEYLTGKTGTTFEVIINSNPAITYLLNSNSLMTMIDVISHASIGHSSFFKNNYLFKMWTNADAILPFCNHAREFIRECENKYGYKTVESLLDALHAVSNISYDHKPVETFHKPKDKLYDKVDSLFQSIFSLQDQFSSKARDITINPSMVWEKSENFLRILKKHGDLLDWQIQIIDIFLKINQYFYPQIQTKIINEGWATFCDYTLGQDLYDNDIIDDGMFLEHLHVHGAVNFQKKFSFMKGANPKINTYYPLFGTSINPYYLGFNIFKEIRRVCEEQDEESLRAVPCLRGQNWIEAVKWGMEEFRNDSFISQFLTPRLVRELKLAHVTYDFNPESGIAIGTFDLTHNDLDFHNIKDKLAEAYNFEAQNPTIYSGVVVDSKKRYQREQPELLLMYVPYKNRDLYKPYFKPTLEYIENLWRGKVRFKRDKGD